MSKTGGTPDVIYDVGANNGDDTAYYLLKGYRVVAVEADPKLADALRTRFAREIDDGRAFILNCAVGAEDGEVTFYVNQNHSILSSLILPDTSPDPWKSHRIASRKLSSLVSEYGAPHFIKIDIEGADDIVLADMSGTGIRPEFISVEVHSAIPLCHLGVMGYSKFRLVNCARIGKAASPVSIRTREGGARTRLFPEHSSGPFGEDLNAEWHDLDAIMLLYGARRTVYGPGWFDIHATGAGGSL